ncbi:ATP-dependent DNA ligase [Actinomycetospora aeridis]|uniref:ATP-dependent DNA ligase family profile domain-containing protein n=1 Tax=Actinomycetospora aeridis TaxID=3129231 RepID=A0ABU8N3J6_9PSEU
MLPVPGDLPVDDGWSYEVDWAGVRLLADVDQGELTLRTAEGEDVTARFPEFAGLVDAVADGLLDGEAVMIDGGSPSGDALGERLHTEDAGRARALARERPAVFMVYDVVRLYGVPLDPRPLEERRAVLSRLDLSRATRIQISPAYDDGPALLSGVVAQRLSGVIAKRRGTPYRSGDSGGDWVRVDPTLAAGPPRPTLTRTPVQSPVPAQAAPQTPAPSRRPRHARRERAPQHDTLF